MRRTLIFIAALPLLGSGLFAAPAHAGDDHYVPVRGLDDRFEVVGWDCAGAAAAAPAGKIGESAGPRPGRGGARVTPAADTLGGLLVRDPHPLRGVQYLVNVIASDTATPQGRWRVEVNGDVLTSDPVRLDRDSWTRVWLSDATLHGPDGWTGSIEDYLAEFGKGAHWSAGLLTGPCLDSDEVRLDGIGTRHALYDFEPRTWLTLRVREDGPPYDGRLDAGDPFVVQARAHRWDVAAGRAVLVRDADIVLQRTLFPKSSWETITHAATWRGTADRSAYWRATWQRPDGAIRTAGTRQTSYAHASDPKVDGRRCSPDPDVLPLPPTCRTVTVDAGRVVFSGTGTPPRSSKIRVDVRTDSFDGPLLSRQGANLGRDGRWRVAIDTGTHDHLYVQVNVLATSDRHELMGGGTMRFPLAVR
jgi:hypothetical protein